MKNKKNMTLEKFKNLIDKIKEVDKFIDDLYDFKISIIDTCICDNFYKVVKTLITECYGDEGYDWFSWFVYEKSCSNNNLIATDENGNEICGTVEDLYDYLEKNYKK